MRWVHNWLFLSQQAKAYSINALGSRSYPVMTGSFVHGKQHVRKGRDSIKAYERWLKNNPTARAGDRAAAENIIMDVRHALGE